MVPESIPPVLTPKTVRPGYRSQAADTNVDADIYLFARLRQLALKQRIEIAIAHNRGVRKLCLAGIKSRHRGASLEEIRLQFARAVLSEKFPPGFQPQGGESFAGVGFRSQSRAGVPPVEGTGVPSKLKNSETDETIWIQDSISLAGELHQILESVNIPYYVSRGVASSIHGEPRSTRDLDLVIEIQRDQINLLVTTLEAAGYYCPEKGAVEDLQQGRDRMLNITHTETIANADLYVTDTSAFAASQMARRRLLDVEGMPNFWLISPEDLLLQKLVWGRGSQSQKQWRDVLGILKLQADFLDYGYLTEWAENLGLVDLISQAFTEAGIL
ncbi:hypothetical protein [Calothrix sp. UHCC 0171]|uniref:hypothetical protein n=1 Tax=Calothrix sp. UHCC 0171 TaxID=3110245 RepID=UPI002B1F0C0E|nr:hypothetical protein [Calothrix sp. UHCC 0171]MEA5573867.1 hypothetical protein [Calothrix sp. UHCC 0171]